MTPYATYRPRPRRTTTVLSVLAVVLFLTAGVFAGLYVFAVGDRDTAADRLDERRTELDGVTDQVAATDEAVDEAEQRNDELETTRTELAACVDVVRHYLWDGLTGAERDAALDQMFTFCG